MQLGPPRWNESTRDNKLRRTAEILRGPVEWSLDLTNRCVGRCAHCFNRSVSLTREELPEEAVLSLTEELAGMQPMGLCLCGGEPMLRASLALQVVERMTKARTQVNMVTTGLTLGRDAARSLKDAGIKSVQVSVDGAAPESHERLRGVPGAFGRAVEALEHLRAAGVETSIAFSPTRWNIGEVEKVVDLGTALDVADVRVQPLMPIGEALFNWAEIAPTNEQYDDFIGWYRGVAGRTRPRLVWGDPVDHLIRFGQFNEAVCHTVAIASDGSITPSPYLPLFVGRAGHHPLARYWQAGLARVWDLRLVRELAFRVRSVEDLARLKPIPFVDPPVRIDLVDDPPARIERVTDLVLRLGRTVETLARKNVRAVR